MMKKLNAVDGFLSVLYRLILQWISLLLLIFCLSLHVTAQANLEARVLSARYDDAGNVIVVAGVGQGISIEAASLQAGTTRIDLEPMPNDLEIEHWFILDAGQGMVNIYDVVREEVRQLIADFGRAERIGIIMVGEESTILEPTSRMSAVNDFLNDYVASPSATTCVLDALETLIEQAQAPNMIRRIVVVAGENLDPTCTGNEVFVNAPVDVIQLGTQDPFLYSAVSAVDGSTYTQVSLRELESAFGVIGALWAGDIVSLIAPVSEAVQSAQVTLTLSTGNGITNILSISGEFTPAPTSTPEPTATVITATPPATATIPTDTPPPTETEVISATETPQTETTAEVTEVAIAAIPSPTEIAAPVNTTPPVSNSTLIIVGGIAAIVVVVVVMGVLLFAGRRAQSVADDELSQTFGTALFNYNDESEFDQTEIVSMRDMMAQVGPTLAAYLHNVDTSETYEIHRPITTLGRQQESDILIEGDKQISRHHVRFTVNDDGTIWIVRLTQNPILVNGVAIDNMKQLNVGDTIILSPTLRVLFEDANNEDA